MAELRIWDRSSTYYKSLYTKEAKKDIDLYFPNKSGMILSDGSLQDFLAQAGNLKDPQITQPDPDHPQVGTYSDGSFYGPLTIGPYDTAETFIGELDTTEWVCARDIEFTDIVDTTSDPEFREEWMPDSIEAGVTYYIKYRFISCNVVSEWSEPIQIKFRIRGYAVPKLTIIENGNQPIFKSSPNIPFGPDGEPVHTYRHRATTWTIKNRKTGTIVHEVKESTTDLYTFNTPPNILSTFEEYKIIVTYHFDTNDSTLNKTRKAIGYFELLNAIEAPILTYKTDNGDYRVEGSEFRAMTTGSVPEIHQYTHWTVKNSTGAVIYDEPYSTSLRTLHLLSIDGVQHNNIYTVECKYVGAKASSARVMITVVIPPLQVSSAGSLKLLPQPNGDLKVVFTERVDEGLPLYLSFVITDANTGTVIYNKLDNDIEPYGKNEITYTVPHSLLTTYLTDKYINQDGTTNLKFNLLGVGKIVTDRGEFDYTSINVPNYFSFTMPTLTVVSRTLSPTFVLGKYSASHDWIKPTRMFWAIVKKGMPRTTTPIAANSSTTDLTNIKVIGVALETATEYDIYVDYFTNVGIYTKVYTFTTPSYTFANPTVTLVGNGLYKTITAGNYNLSNYSGTGGEHYATTYTVYNTDGTILYTTGKNITNLTSLTLTSAMVTLEYNTVYQIGVIFHSKSDIASPETRVQYMCKPYIVDVGQPTINGVSNLLETPILGLTFSVTGGLVHEEGSSVSLENVNTAIWTVTKSTGEVIFNKTKTGDPFSCACDVTLQPLTNYTLIVKLISISGFESDVSTTVFRTMDPSLHNVIKITPKIDLDTTGVYESKVILALDGGPINTRLNNITLKWGDETKTQYPLANTGTLEFIFEAASISKPLTISLHYGSMVKAIVMYDTACMAGDNTELLNNSNEVGLNQAIVDFQLNHDSLIEIQ